MTTHQKIIRWAKEKGILDNATPRDQFLKVAEEFGEIAAAMARKDRDALKDAIGDTAVTLIILAKMQGLDFNECIECAYNEIAGRKGEMRDGIFVKNNGGTIDV